MRAASATALLLTFVLAACGGESTPASPTTDTPPPPPPPAAAEEAPPTGSLAAREAQTEPSNTINYDCEGTRITLAQEGEGDDARVQFVVDGVTLDLPRAETAQGERFADADGNAFWRHGTDEARLGLQGQHERNCARVY
ncbi:MliC family protein [Luteimonas sp. XNQY3]|nr:MliC family protein [Luteimonas sp. XNQY3]MCD9006508.1 MliC family protein [Luteimonas sp. XNQY3]